MAVLDLGWLETGKRWQRFAASFGAGVFCALAMAPVYALPLLLIGIGVFIRLLDGVHTRLAGVKSAATTGWFFGLGYFLVGTYWMSFSFFVQADQFAWMAPFAMLGLPSFLAIFFATLAAVCAKFWPNGWPRVVFFAGMWVLLEFLRGHILTGLPWNLAGQAFAASPILAQSASVYGVYGLSLVVVLICALPMAGLDARERQRPAKGLVASTALLMAVIIFGALRLSSTPPDEEVQGFVRIVQPNIPQVEKIDPQYWGRNFYKQVELSKGPAPTGKNLFIIWPENGAPLLNEATSALDVLSSTLPDDAILLAGAVRRETDSAGNDQFFNSVLAVAQTPAGRKAVASYDKHHLVPFGEYLPLYGLLDAIGLAKLTPYGDAGFTAGSGPKVLNVGGSAFAPLICYEVIFPGALYPKGKRPDWLVTVTNDAWFGDTSGPRQHLDMARLRAIESGLPMARAANTGISAMIDPKGRILARVKLYESGKIESPIPAKLPPTLYDRWGDGLAVLMMCIAILAGLLGNRVKRPTGI